MDIADIVTTDYESLDVEARVADLGGVLDDPTVPGVVVERDGDYVGVVTRRQLATSRVDPAQKLRSLGRAVPRVAPHDDVREVAALMLDGDSRLLPVFSGERFEGVVSGDGILRAVEPFLDAATVEDAHTHDLVTVTPETTFGEALHRLREARITHLPVVEDGSAVGVLSLYDVVPLATRESERAQGGAPDGTDAFGGPLAGGAGRTHGGFGSRAGEAARLLDLPVRDLMVAPVRTTTPSATLREAVGAMFDAGVSSLVVAGDGGGPVGIVTKTDVLDALTWEAEGSRAVQVYGTDLMDDLSYDGVVSAVEALEGMDAASSIIDAKVHFHEHDETLRGTPLLLSRLRVHTDDGLFVASGEGYGARQAFGEARGTLERQLRDAKTHGRTKKHPDADFWERRFGWWLSD